MRLIDADAFSVEMKKRQDECSEWAKEAKGNYRYRALGAWSMMSEVKLTLDKQPTIDAVEVKHGEWLEEGNSCSYIFHCSVCGGVAYFVHGKGRGRNMERRFCGYRYCPNCGASMDGEEKSDG